MNSNSLQNINSILKNRTMEAPVLKTFYVGNLEWKTTEEELKNFFSPYGRVSSVQIKKFPETGLSKGYAFVTMENADQAMQELNGKEFRGRILKINEAYRNRIQNYRQPQFYSPHFNYREPDLFHVNHNRNNCRPRNFYLNKRTARRDYNF